MNYRKYNGLSDYLINDEGKVFTQELNPVPYERKGKIWMVKLTTDETHALIQGKSESVRLIRRYTKEQVLKMYEGGKDFTHSMKSIIEKEVKEKLTSQVKDISKATGVKVRPKDLKKIVDIGTELVSTALVADKVPVKGKRIKKDGVIYKSANLASKSVGLSINTVMKRAKEGSDGFSYVD